MRVAVALVSLLAVAAIVGSAVSVIDKDRSPRLAVDVSGVPGYIYYDRTYDLTIEYANLGGRIGGPVELVAELPETFALAAGIGDPARHGERLVWTLDGLDAGEHGAVTITVQGTLPDDLTNAVYDLAGYEGHTAFVEGFALAVSLTARGASAGTLAVADAGEQQNEIAVNKVCDPADDPGQFSVNIAGLGGVSDLDCGTGFSFGGFAPGTYTITETGGTGTDITDYTTTFSGDCTDNGDRTADFTIGATDEFECTITNTLVDGPPPPLSSLTIVKQCDEDTSGVAFEIFVDPQLTLLQLGCGQSSSPIEIETGVEYTVSEEQAEGYAAPVFEGACAPDGIVELEEPDAVTCTVVNSLLDDEPLDGFFKDTLEEDEVVNQFEEFDWYITVPDTGGDWYLWDFLPPGFILTDVGANLGIECSPILVFGLVCSGYSTEEGEGEVVTLTVRASIICGHYTNVAKLFTGIEPPLLAHDSVTVCGDEDQEPPEELPPEETSSGSSDRPWWERLWTLLFE